MPGTLMLSPTARQLAARRLGLPLPWTCAQPAQTAEQARRARERLVKAFRQQLALAHPTLFADPPSAPLKIGIDRDLRARHPEVSWRTLRIALRRHVSSPAYLRLLVAGAPRIALDGSVAGHVTA